jgi:SOS-response transcriptional repressor LexA
MTIEQQKLMNYIIAYKRQWNGNSPSFREMMAEMGYGGTGRLYTQLNALQKLGQIQMSGSRGIIIPGTSWGFVEEGHEAAKPVFA